MADTTIRCRQNGPFVVEGPAMIIDHEGNRFPITGATSRRFALCRCGHSGKKPFCDGSHRTCGFVAGELRRKHEAGGLMHACGKMQNQDQFRQTPAAPLQVDSLSPSGATVFLRPFTRIPRPPHVLPALRAP